MHDILPIGLPDPGHPVLRVAAGAEIPAPCTRGRPWFPSLGTRAANAPCDGRGAAGRRGTRCSGSAGGRPVDDRRRRADQHQGPAEAPEGRRLLPLRHHQRFDERARLHPHGTRPTFAAGCNDAGHYRAANLLRQIRGDASLGLLSGPHSDRVGQRRNAVPGPGVGGNRFPRQARQLQRTRGPRSQLRCWSRPTTIICRTTQRSWRTRSAAARPNWPPLAWNSSIAGLRGRISR